MQYTKSTILKSFAWKLLEKFSLQIIAFVVAIVLARLLSPEDFGMAAIIIVIMTISDVIIQGGLNMAVVQKKDPNSDDYSTIFWCSLLLSLVIYLLVFIFAGRISSFFHMEGLKAPLRVLCLTLIAYAFNSVQRAYVSKNMLYRQQFIAALIAVLSAGATGIILAVRGYGVWALVWYYLLTTVLTSFLMLITVKWRPTFRFSVTSFKALFGFGWKIMLSNTIISVFNNVRSIIVGRLFPAGLLGFYDRGRQFPAIVVENINASVQTVIFPVLSEDQDNTSAMKETMRKSIRICTFVIFPVLAWLLACADSVTELVLTAKWLPAVPYMRIFCIAYLLLPLQLSNLEAIKALGHSEVTLRIELIKKAVEIAVLIVSAKMGIMAIAWGVVICNAAALLINLPPTLRYLGYSIREQISDILPQLLISALAGAAAYAIGLCGLGVALKVLLQLSAGILVYYLLSALFRVKAFESGKSYMKSMIQ
ncbi:MAG: lipopolysaccharide biosynthesis protein [Bacteroidales bacterium]|nr:lipopolysaccharide biosynthesis protein [Bacteroidales bacterium]